MKREIKFRGLRTDGKGWVTGVPFFIHEERKCFMIDNCKSGNLTQEDSTFDGYEVDRKSVGQFTGLKDVNGKDAYEGDKTINGTIEFSFGCWNINGDWTLNGRKFEIIGNRHEHKKQ